MYSLHLQEIFSILLNYFRRFEADAESSHQLKYILDEALTIRQHFHKLFCQDVPKRHYTVHNSLRLKWHMKCLSFGQFLKIL